MTTPRYDIAGLSEILKGRAAGTGYGGGDPLCAEAATAIDSLLKERDALKEERDQWRTQAKYETDVAHAASEEIARLNQEREALQARVKELEERDRLKENRFAEWCSELEARALRAEQERDTLARVMEDTANELGCEPNNEVILETILRLQQERDGLEAQLPDGMRHCTITFHECEKGHGRLSATNWIDSGCLCCQRDELKSNQERLWCKACGTVTRDRTCDCNRWPHLADAGYEPKFVNYADAMATDARLACLDVERLQQERDEAYERAAKECSDYARWAEQQISEDDPAESSKSQLFATISNTADDCAAAIRRLAGPEKEG